MTISLQLQLACQHVNNVPMHSASSPEQFEKKKRISSFKNLFFIFLLEQKDVWGTMLLVHYGAFTVPK